MKKSQVTIFIIVGFVILIAVWLFVAINIQKNNNPIQEPGSIDALSIKNFVTGCLKKTGEDSLIEIGYQGGYYYPEDAIDFGFEKLPYYFHDNKTEVPSIGRIENELSTYVSKNIGYCLADISLFDKDVYNITLETAEIVSSIGKNKVAFRLNMPIQLKKRENTILLEEFESDIPSRLSVIHEAAEKIESINAEEKNKDLICLSCIHNVSEEYGLYIEVMGYENNTAIFGLYDNATKIDDMPYSFYFAHKYGQV